MDDAGFDSSQGQEIFLFSKMSRPALWPNQPPVQWVLGVIFLRVEWLWHKLATDKNSGAAPVLPLYVFMAWIGATFNFNFTFTVYRVVQK
jgi:hypothetical protein